MNNYPNQYPNQGPNYYDDREYVDPPYQNIKSDSEAGPLDHLSDGLEGQARTAFISKVYALLCLELLITFGFCLLSQYSQAYRSFQLDNGWVLAIPIVLLIIALLVAFCVPQARAFPIDMLLLLVFVLCFSYIISFACSAVVNASDQSVVPVAIAVTLGITIALTLYAFFCKGNYLLWLGIILVCATIGLCLGIAAIFVYMPVLTYLICAVGLIIYGVYLVIITKMIIGNQLGGFPMDSPIIASVFLYIYIMRIFLYILAIVARAKR